MQKIHQLPQSVISKIAAGEVIERPVYAVKELLENSLDAGATDITIDIIDAGLKRISVQDNGEGMHKDDLLQACKLHTTSKILSEEGLDHISSFGFRGEALASLAAISHLTLQSRMVGEQGGNSIELLDGIIKNSSPIGMPVGTKVIVENLFHSVPGRKKFLKSKQTEFRHIVDWVSRIALAHPEIRFILTHNNKHVFDLPKASLPERLRKLLGDSLFHQLLPVQYESSYITLSGFIARPQAMKSIKEQYLFINKRSVTDKHIASSIKDAYATLLDPKKHPVFILSLTIPYEHVDVNVHPRKESIRFVDSNMVRDAFHHAVMKTLSQNNLVYFSDATDGMGLQDQSHTSWRTGTTKTFAGRLLKENQVPWDIRPVEEISSDDVTQFHNVYLVTQTTFGIAFVDQHAAHERILYEQFLDSFKKQSENGGSYMLSKSLSLDFSVVESELLNEHIVSLQQLGFGIEHFKDTTFVVSSVPLVFQDRDIVSLLNELLEMLQKGKSVDVDSASTRMIAYLACRAAIKAGESLTKKQAKELLKKLSTTPHNTTCPHGRPTKIIIDIEKFHKMFKRK